MSARAIISGALAKPPMRKTSAKGTSYLLASIREGKGDEAHYWTAFIFSEAAIAQIDEMQVGEPICVAGEFEATVYAAEGKPPRVTFKVVVDGVLNARPAPKKKEQRAPARNDRRTSQKGGEFNDDIPF